MSSKWGYVYTAGWEVDADPPEVKHHDVETLRRQLGGDARAPRRPARRSTRSTPRRRTAACWRTTRCWTELRACGRAACASALSVSGTGQARDDRARARARPLRRGAGDLEPARARGRAGAGARPHDAGLSVYRQGGAGQRAARPARAGGRADARRRRELGATPDALALAAVLAQPWADVVLSGAATVETLRPNLAAAELAWPTRTSTRAGAAREDSDEYWERRSSLPWN